MLGNEKGEHKALLVMHSDEGKRVERSQTGFYSRIVCADCEASFKEGDDALIEVSRTHGEVKPWKNDRGETIAFEFSNIDNSTLHRGVITTLFRAHLSDNHFFQQVNLPPKFFEPLRQLLLSDEPTHHSQFEVVMRVTPTLYGKVIQTPRRQRFFGVNTYWISFPYWTAIVKVDGQNSRDLHPVRIGADAHPVATLTSNLNPSELHVLRKALDGRREAVLRITGIKLGNANSERSDAEDPPCQRGNLPD
jgi:hypothetical protein